MLNSRIIGIVALLCAVPLLDSCVPNTAHRPIAAVCSVGDCQQDSIEVHPIAGAPGQDYLLGVVEFDDQGAQLQPAQMSTLFDRLEVESRTQDLCIVVFVHGWKHNAAADDPDVISFRALLAGMAKTEAAHAPGMWGKPRKLVGIYAGWRGQSSALGDLAADLTFWSRKDAAQRVALGSIRELLGRARALRDGLDRTTWSGRRLPLNTPAPPGERLRSTRLLTIGHSFGGLIVYTALAQALIDRAVTAQMAGATGPAENVDKAITAYGDLVVIVNPAVEATSWEPLHAILHNRPVDSFARRQKPAFVEVTSSADDATGIAFPLGRSLNTALESFTSAEQRTEALKSIGHYPPFWTHRLTRAADAPAAADFVAAQDAASPGALMGAECAAQTRFDAQFRQGGYLQPGWTRRYAGGAVLTHLTGTGYDANDPYWMVLADKAIIADHSDIEQPIFVDFIRELYDELLLDDDECSKLKAQ
jgi:hypothetical protein